MTNITKKLWDVTKNPMMIGLFAISGCSPTNEIREPNYDRHYRFSPVEEMHVNTDLGLDEGGIYNTKIETGKNPFDTIPEKTVYLSRRPFTWDNNNGEERQTESIVVKWPNKDSTVRYCDTSSEEFQKYNEKFQRNLDRIDSGHYTNGCKGYYGESPK